jgi:hypothetical protein
LGDKDNPYNVFASLNSKGLSLTESDLIKNYLFMKVDQRNQEEVYAQYWKPMEAMIGENMSEFIRHFLMSDGVIIAKNEVYNQFRSAFEGTQILDLLKTLNQASKYYYTILNPETITSSDEREIKLLLVRVSRLKLTVVYPFYLRLYMLYGSNRLAKNKFIEILRIVENLLVRRLIAGEGIKGLNKELPMLCAMASQDSLDSLPERIKNAVTTKSSFGYISDNRLTSRLLSERLYRSGEQSSISKLVLEEIDKLLSQEANERIDYTNLTVEHIMPQKLSDAWREDLTEDDINQHEDYLHTIGNLTLTGLNEKMGNGTFKQKKIEYQKSALKLNAEIISNTFWTISQIKERSQQLSQHIITLWPNLKQETTKDVLETDYTWKRITHITISGTQMPCESWRSALVNTVNYLLEIDKDQLMSKLSEYFVNETEPNNGKYSKLNNGYYINTNYNANSIVKLINRFAAAYDIPEDEITFEVV